MSVSINGTNGLTFGDGSAQNTGGYTGFRNRIINGDMRIDQRNAGASVTNAVGMVWPIDRFWAYGTQASKYTVQQNAGSVTPPAGFKNYLGVTSLSAYTVGATDFFQIYHSIEGLNVADFGWGTANAATITIGFWVRSSLTGAFGGSLLNSVPNRSYIFSYTINSANTWEYKTVTIAGDQSGVWATDNTAGIYLGFNLGSGANVSGAAGAWGNAAYRAPTGATSVVGTSGATFYITGVQLEKGSVATPFEHRPYGTELGLCQRYLPTITANGANNTFVGSGTYRNNTTQVILFYNFPVQARVPPTGLVLGSGVVFTVINPAAVNAFGVTSPAIGSVGTTFGCIDGTVSGGVANTAVQWLINGGADGRNAYFTGCEL